jgi:hypothetical protein
MLVVEPDPVPLPVLRDVQEMPGKLDRGGPKVKEWLESRANLPDRSFSAFSSL